jgi:thiol:disulfide interchange protein
MIKHQKRLTFSAIVALGLAVAVAGDAAPPPAHVRVDLVSEVRAIAPGGSFHVGLRQRIDPGWHTYWINPGDTGEPPRLEWDLPAGFRAGPLAWPHPERIPAGPAMSFGYSGEVVLPALVTAPAGLVPGTRVTLRGMARWLVCKTECIPEEAPVALTLPVAAGPAPPDPAGAALIAAARRAVPTPSPWPAAFEATADTVRLTLAAPGFDPARVPEVAFYPARWGVIEHAAPQTSRVAAGGITLEVARGPLAEAVAAPIEGVLVVTERLDGGLVRHAVEIRAEPRAAARAVAPSADVTLPLAVALALAGGLLLNLMPCVLPVLSVKALGLVQHAAGPPAGLRRHGWAYTAGVLASFGLLAGTLLALRAGGEQLGWGFQLQSPVVVTLLAYVLFAMGLALSGVLVLGAGLAGLGHGLASRGGYPGSLFAGALATVAATPCTAPFMGVAVGFAATQPWPTALLVFEALGLGLALPYLALTHAPAWRRRLPRPGPWMEWLKQALAFPLYASVAWLVWVVSEQAGPPGVAAALGGLVLIAAGAWLHAAARGAGGRARRLASASAVVLVAGAVALGPLAGGSRPAATTRAETSAWEPFTPERLAAARAAGRPVFVNVTAAWCITCLVNERVALGPAVSEALARKGVTALKADWTRRDPAITALLGSFGRNGVPLYVVYPAAPSAAPAVLPQVLTEGMVLEALERI